MNSEELIEMARQAGLPEAWISNTGVLKWSDLEAFAKLVEDAAFKRWAAQTRLAVEHEREACAKVCDARYMGDNSREDMETKRCAKSIRARS